MSKVLFISNISSQITSFATASIVAAHDIDLEFHHASNWETAKDGQIELDEAEYNIKIHSLSISRNPFAWMNLTAYKELVDLIRREKIDYIHCNTPTGGVLGRLAGKKCKVKKIIYQAHGFHFYKGAPKINWLLYYPVEKFLARYTDALITINQEDYKLAKNKLKLRNNGKVYYVPGVGIDVAQYNTEVASCQEKRRELGLRDSDVALISMGDLIDRKNYDVAIRLIAEANNPNLQYFICGKGPEEAKLVALAQRLGVSDQIHFLGFRSDIKELLSAADLFLFTTKQEGLPRSMMEAMASGLPCVVSRIRGNTDLLENSGGGYLCGINDIPTYAKKVNLLAGDTDLRQQMGKNNLRAIQNFSTERAITAIKNVYLEEFGRETL
jgi:glycosyltransferase involved in cell wall biosynthesis